MQQGNLLCHSVNDKPMVKPIFQGKEIKVNDVILDRFFITDVVRDLERHLGSRDKIGRFNYNHPYNLHSEDPKFQLLKYFFDAASRIGRLVAIGMPNAIHLERSSPLGAHSVGLLINFGYLKEESVDYYGTIVSPCYHPDLSVNFIQNN